LQGLVTSTGSRQRGVTPTRSATLPFHDEPLVAPVAVRVVDVGSPLGDLCLERLGGEPPYRTLLAVARLGDDPLGVATFAVSEAGWVSSDRLSAGLVTRFAADASGSRSPAPSSPVWQRPPQVSVVVATCCNAAVLQRCVRSILDCDDVPGEVIVVENRPGASATRRMLTEEFPGERRVRYVEEPRRGASRARNAGLAHARGDVVAFVDDDVVVDRGWIRRSVDALTRSDDAACCTGLILPLELESESQLLLDQFAAFGKGFQRKAYSLPGARADDPLLPYTVGSIGSGASMVFRTEVVRRLGGFDTTLGPGTPTTGAEDLELLLRVLRAGQTVVYEPSAIVWHQHPDGMPRLRRQAFRYGVGLGAMLAKLALVGPERRDLLRAVPAGLRYLRDPGSRKNATRPANFPRRLIWLERIGLLVGPPAYVWSALNDRKRRVLAAEGR
jgi:GT2 family glycosyltransferase